MDHHFHAPAVVMNLWYRVFSYELIITVEGISNDD